MNKRFAYLIIASMILGVTVGWACNQFLDPVAAKSAASNLSLITDVFLRLIKMIIAPLVFTTLVAGIAHMEDAAAVGRIGAKTMLLVHQRLGRLASAGPADGPPAASRRKA
jgi:Na+/H+-dicarboxylate symporter